MAATFTAGKPQANALLRVRHCARAPRAAWRGNSEPLRPVCAGMLPTRLLCEQQRSSTGENLATQALQAQRDACELACTQANGYSNLLPDGALGKNIVRLAQRVWQQMLFVYLQHSVQHIEPMRRKVQAKQNSRAPSAANMNSATWFGHANARKRATHQRKARQEMARTREPSLGRFHPCCARMSTRAQIRAHACTRIEHCVRVRAHHAHLSRQQTTTLSGSAAALHPACSGAHARRVSPRPYLNTTLTHMSQRSRITAGSKKVPTLRSNKAALTATNKARKRNAAPAPQSTARECASACARTRTHASICY